MDIQQWISPVLQESSMSPGIAATKAGTETIAKRASLENMVMNESSKCRGFGLVVCKAKTKLVIRLKNLA